MKWGVTGKTQDRDEFVDLVKLWRKDGRAGLNRTLLEKKARKFFKRIRKHKNLGASRKAAKEHGEMQKENKIGFHSDEWKERHREIAKMGAEAMKKKGRKPTRYYIVENTKTGEKFRIDKFMQFCEDYNLDPRNLNRVMRLGGTCKGWKIERFLLDW